MNANRMREVAKHAKKYGVRKTAKDLLTFDGNKTVDYSFKEKFQICVDAVRRAVKWSKADKKRRL